jgi:hypothetical protein
VTAGLVCSMPGHAVFGAVIAALAQVGLRIAFLYERPDLPRAHCRSANASPTRTYHMPPGRSGVPLLNSIKATRPH